MTTPIVDPQLAAFWASDPSRLTPPSPVQDPEHTDPRKMIRVGVEIAAAFLVVRHLVSQDMQEAQPQVHDSMRFIKRFWRRRAPIWAQLAVPAIKKGYSLGQIQGLSEEELEAMAQSYAEDLGDYINDTSSRALLEGFYEQLGAKWSEQLAWQRAAAAFGLDSQQMRTYVRNAINPTIDDPVFQVLPDKAKRFIDNAILARADKLGGHEAWQSMEAGKAIAWLHLQNSGQLPIDAEKEWLTAADERVCPQCGPLNRKRVAMNEQWQTPDGNKYWAPGVHPNCRCDIKLIYPEIVNDPWQSVVKRSKIDSDSLVYGHEQEDGIERITAHRNGKHLGSIELRPVDGGKEIHYIKTRRGYRRRGVASALLTEARKTSPVQHGTDLSRSGRKFAAVSKNEPGDPFNRDRRGRFARVETREAPRPDPLIRDFLEELEKPKVVDPFATKEVKDPFAKPRVADPFVARQQAADPFQVPDPFKASNAVADPFVHTKEAKDPFATTKKPGRKIRQVLVLLPSGKFNLVNKDDLDDIVDAEPVNNYLFVADHYANMEDISDPEISDSVPHTRGKTIVDFDYDNSKVVSLAKPYSGIVENYMEDASSLYTDEYIGLQNDPDIQQAIQNYNNAWTSMANWVKANKANVVYSLDPAEVRKILNESGSYTTTDTLENLQARIVNAPADSNIEHALLQHLADKPDFHKPSSFNEYGRAIQDAQEEMAKFGLRLHTPQVYIIPETNSQTDYYDDGEGSIGLRGQYRVYDTIYRSAAEEMGSDRPPNIKGIKFIYLEPKDEDWAADEAALRHAADEAQAQDYTRYNSEYDDLFRRPDDPRWSS